MGSEGPGETCEANASTSPLRDGNEGQSEREGGGEPIDERASAVIPSRVVVPHRSGNMTVTLSDLQRSSRKRAEIKVLYKELKHNHVNSLDRLITVLFCFLIASLTCHIFSALTSEWVLVARPNSHRALGMFVTCHLALVSICVDYGLSNKPRHLTDAWSGEVVCEATPSFVSSITTAMWTLSGLQFFSITVSLLIMLRVSRRPTRSALCTMVMCLLSASFPCSVVNIVLFFFFRARCERMECDVLHLEPPQCRTLYGWGFNVFTVAAFMDLSAFVTSVCLNSYPKALRNRARQLLTEMEERKRGGWQLGQSPALPESGLASHRAERGAESQGQSAAAEVDLAPFLTAAEMNVAIEGASDWVYDDRSDLFYSFELDMFWDPTTCCYYDRRLQSWLATPDGRVGLRDAETQE